MVQADSEQLIAIEIWIKKPPAILQRLFYVDYGRLSLSIQREACRHSKYECIGRNGQSKKQNHEKTLKYLVRIICPPIPECLNINFLYE